MAATPRTASEKEMGLVEYGGSDEEDHDGELNGVAASQRPQARASSSKSHAGVRLGLSKSAPLKKSPSPPVYTHEKGPSTFPSSLVASTSPTSPSAWRLARYGIPQPDIEAQCDPAVEARLAGFHAAREAGGESFNTMLWRNKMFRNPRILDKLVSFIDVDDKGSNFGTMWDRENMLQNGSAKVISEQQKRIAEDREAAKASGKRTAIDFGPGSDRPPSSASKWDLKEGKAERGRDDGGHRDRHRDRRRSRSPIPKHSSSGHHR